MSLNSVRKLKNGPPRKPSEEILKVSDLAVPQKAWMTNNLHEH